MAYDRDIRGDSASDTLGKNNPGTNPQAEQLLPGAPVYDVAGELIGNVDDAGFVGDALRISRSGLLTSELAVPLSSIARTGADGVYLSVTKDQVQKGYPDEVANSPGDAVAERKTNMATDMGGTSADLDVAPRRDP